MATWNNLIDNVGDELALDSYKSAGADVAQTQRALNRTLQQLFSGVGHPFAWRIIEAPLVLVPIVGQTDYDLSTIVGGRKVQDIFAAFVHPVGGRAYQITERPLRWFIDHYADVDNAGGGQTQVYTRVGQYTVRLGPKPAAITDEVKFYISEEFADITTFTDTITLPSNVQEVVELGTLSRLYRFLHEFELARELKAEYEAGVGGLIRTDKNNPNMDFIMEGSFRQPVSGDYWRIP